MGCGSRHRGRHASDVGGCKRALTSDDDVRHNAGSQAQVGSGSIRRTLAIAVSLAGRRSRHLPVPCGLRWVVAVDAAGVARSAALTGVRAASRWLF